MQIPKMSLTRNRPVTGVDSCEYVLIRRCMALTFTELVSDGYNSDPPMVNGLKDSHGPTTRKDSKDINGLCEGPGPPPLPLVSSKCFLPLDVFRNFVKENTDCYWNPSLVESVNSLEYKGCLKPCTVLVSGTEYNLEVIRSAWSRRLLRPPNGYAIAVLGDVDPVKMKIVQQTHFAPLPEALCKVVYDLNVEGIVADMTIIGRRLKVTFPEISLPSENVLYQTLGSLIKERKLYHTGNGYSVVTPETFRLLAISPPIERQMLLTNEEAIVKLHGTSFMEGRSACTQTNNQQRDSNLVSWSSAERILSPTKPTTGKLKRCHSLKLLRSKDKDKLSRTNSFKASKACPVVPTSDVKNDLENVEPSKKEKQPSMFSKLFRRGRLAEKKNPKCSSTSSQFPPRDRSDPDYVYYNSRATQTLEDENQMPPRSYKSRSSSLGRVAGKERNSLYMMASTPITTSKRQHRNNRNQLTDMYNCRSSSVPRKSSPSPKRDAHPENVYSSNNFRRQSPKPHARQRQGQTLPSATLPPTIARLPTSETYPKNRPKYESVFSPITKSDEMLLRAGDKYGEETTTSTNVWPWRPTSVVATRPSQTLLSRPYQNGTPTWRQPYTVTQSKLCVDEPKKPEPIIGVPQQVFSREVTNISPSDYSTKPQVTSTFAQNSVRDNGPIKKNLQLDGNVDLEITVNTDNQSSIKPNDSLSYASRFPRKDMLKIDATWKQSVTNKTSSVVETTNAKNSGQVLSTVTNITATVTHGNAKENDVQGKSSGLFTANDSKDKPKVLRSTTVIDCTGKCSIVNDLQKTRPIKDSSSSPNISSPRSPVTEDAKRRDFFTESPSPSEPHGSKDDSGFSSSASTSRPMSVSPC